MTTATRTINGKTYGVKEFSSFESELFSGAKMCLQAEDGTVWLSVNASEKAALEAAGYKFFAFRRNTARGVWGQ